MRKKITRRIFVKNASLAAAAVTVSPGLGLLVPGPKYDPKGIPTRVFGTTGVEIPVYVLGLGSRWMAVEDNDKALEILEYAFNQGLYYWDTAASYGNEQIIPCVEILERFLTGRVVVSCNIWCIHAVS